MNARLVSFAFFILLLLVGNPIIGEIMPAPAGYAPDYVLIKFRAEFCREALKLPVSEGLEWLLDQLRLPPGARLREPQINLWLRSNLSLPQAPLRPGGLMLDRFLYLDLPPGLSVTEILARLRNHPLVDYTEPDGIGRLCLVPTDSGFQQQYQHFIPDSYSSPAQSGALNTPEAWDITTGSSNVTVAIIDSGIDAKQFDFAGRLVRGYNVISNNFNTQDTSGHGTGVATVLGANANNPSPNYPDRGGYGLVGVDWKCRMMPIKVADYGETTSASLGAQGIDFAVTNGCKVICFSASVQSEDGITLGRSVSNAIAKGVIVVCAAGNNGAPIWTYPSKFPSTICVGASKGGAAAPFGRAEFSNYGPELDVLAPGFNILVHELGNNYYRNGTSLSAGMVAGICSLLAAVRPDLTQEQARVLLGAGTREDSAYVSAPRDTPGYDIYYGWGLANAYHSVLLASTRITQAQRLAGNQWEFSWASPTNDYIKQPYLVQFTPSLSRPWLELTNGSFRYERTLVYTNGGFGHQTNRTYWRGEVPASSSTGQASYFRVGIRLKE